MHHVLHHASCFGWWLFLLNLMHFHEFHPPVSLSPNPMDSLEGICPCQFFCPIRVEALTSAHCGHGSLASLWPQPLPRLSLLQVPPDWPAEDTTAFIYLFFTALGLCCFPWTCSNCSVRVSHCGIVSCCWEQTLGHAGISSCGSWALEHRLNSDGMWV